MSTFEWPTHTDPSVANLGPTAKVGAAGRFTAEYRDGKFRLVSKP